MPDLFSCAEQIQPTSVPHSFHINWGSTKANCHTRSLSRQSWSIAIWKQVPLQKIQRAPKHLSDIGSHSRRVGCHNTLFIQLILFLQGVLQPSYQFSSWGSNSIGGINPLMLGQPQEVSYIICVTEAEAEGPRRLEWLRIWCLEKGKVIKMKRQPRAPMTEAESSPSAMKIPGLVHTLSTALRFIQGNSLVHLWCSGSFLGQNVDSYAPPPLPHCPLTCTNTQNLKIYCLLAEQLLGLTQDGLKKRKGICPSEGNCRKGNSLTHPLLLVSMLLWRYMGNILYKALKRSIAHNLIFILLQFYSKEIITDTQSNFYTIFVRMIFAVIFLNTKLKEQKCLKKGSRSK